MKKKCLHCGNLNEAFENTPNAECPECGAIYLKIATTQKRIKDNVAAKINKELSTPLLSKIFYLISFLGLLGGIFFCIVLWPGDPGFGKEWKSIAYIPALTWLMAGIIECALFFAIGLGLKYLRAIYIKTIHA